METKYKPNYAIHPGELLRDEMKALKLSQKEVAEKANISKTIINEVIKGKRNINADLAVKLEKVLESPARFWLNTQSLYDECKARIKLEKDNVACNTLVDLNEDFYSNKEIKIEHCNVYNEINGFLEAA